MFRVYNGKWTRLLGHYVPALAAAAAGGGGGGGG